MRTRLTQPQEITLSNPRLDPKIRGKKPASKRLRHNKANAFIYPALNRRYQLIMDVLSEHFVSERKYVPGIVPIQLTHAHDSTFGRADTVYHTNM
jgi:hypothetical protein